MAYTKSFRPGGNRQKPNTRSFRPGKGPRQRSTSKKRGAYIHPSKFINKAVAKAEEVPYEATHTFADFPFSPKLQANIARKGYVTPSPIQDQAIPHVIEGRDVVGLANTGTGKTAAFTLPILDKLPKHPTGPVSLILAPTRELAQQIEEQFREFSSGMQLYSAICVGGTNIERQIRAIKRHPHVIIGTPGRIKDLISRNVLRLDSIEILILDEADRMLDMGFVNDIRDIASLTPPQRQTLFFSATINDSVKSLINDFLNDPVTVSVRTAETSEHVEQDVIVAKTKEDKIDKLIEIVQEDGWDKVLVFGETKYGVQRLSDKLSAEGIPSVAIHGNKSQSQRQRALKDFKDGKAQILVATDVAARGLDIPNVSHVINFDQPATYEDYVHRIGRTGRGGAKGSAYTFISQ